MSGQHQFCPRLSSAKPLAGPAGPAGTSSVCGFCLPVLLLAYMKGNANLCRAIVRSGARLGVTNNQGVNIFNYQVATKQLLFRLLGEWPRSALAARARLAVLIIWKSWCSRYLIRTCSTG